MSTKAKPITIWREQVDERVWFEARQEDAPYGLDVWLFCCATHAKMPGEVYQVREVFSSDEWNNLQEYHLLHYHKSLLLRPVRKMLCDLDAPELHQQVEVTLRLIAERMCPGTLLWRDEGFAFLRKHYELLQDLEHRLWADLKIPVEGYATWPAFCLPQRLYPEEIALFKRIADEAENWFTWNPDKATYQFVPLWTWRKLDGAWRQSHRPEYWNFR